MASCTGRELGFSRLKRRALEVNFGGGDVSSDGGLLLVREVDRRLQLTQRAAAVLHDPRDPDLITHPLRDLIRQRVDAIVQGYEDLNDHAELRQDVFCGEQLLVSYLRPSKIDAAKPAWAILALLVKRLRQAGPEGRLIVCAGTDFARLQAGTLRSKLLKIGAVIVRNTRRVRVLLSSAYPYQQLFCRAALALRSP